ncbi:hypothetical protein ACNPGY_02695 [Citrobacter cronae]|uniref:hypothetical protein n=1 Tax=Citrobacter cronae TaxID=1748967 RepID=UPI003AA9A194
MKPTYEELERQLEESRREFLAADAAIHNLELQLTDMAVQLANAESKCRELAARTVTLPDVEKWRSVDAVRAQNAYKVLVSKVLAAAGIGVKGE